MVREFTNYTPLKDSLEVLKTRVRPRPSRELVHVSESYGRVLFEDISSKEDVPPVERSHMDGFAVRAVDLVGASAARPVSLKLVRGSPLGIVPKTGVSEGEAHSVLTGGYLPRGADTVLQSERVSVNEDRVVVTFAPRRGEFVFPRGRDIKKGERVLRKGRIIGGADSVLLASLHIERVPVYAKPRVAILPTGNELSAKIKGTEPGKVVETHSMLLSRLIEGAGGLPVPLPIARDDVHEITASIRRALGAADLVLTLAGSSVGEPDLTERAVSSAGKPGILVHGMQVFRGRVMGFGLLGTKGVIILPGPIQGATNAFALMAYPVIRSFLGLGFQEPPSIPARVGADWEAGDRYRDFTKVVYAKLRTDGEEVEAWPSAGETEKITHLTSNDGYILVQGEKVTLKKGEHVRVHLLPGLASPSFGREAV